MMTCSLSFYFGEIKMFSIRRFYQTSEPPFRLYGAYMEFQIHVLSGSQGIRVGTSQRISVLSIVVSAYSAIQFSGKRLQTFFAVFWTPTRSTSTVKCSSTTIGHNPTTCALHLSRICHRHNKAKAKSQPKKKGRTIIGESKQGHNKNLFYLASWAARNGERFAHLLGLFST